MTCRIRVPRLVLLACALALGSIPAPAAAQQADSAAQAVDSATTVGWLRRLCPGQQVMVSTTLRERVMGRCTELGDDRVVLYGRSGDRVELPFAAMDSVWRRIPARRSATTTGAVLGGALVGTLSTLFVMVFCEYDCTTDYLQYAAVGTTVGALSGGVVGRLLGNGKTVWTRAHPR